MKISRSKVIHMTLCISLYSIINVCVLHTCKKNFRRFLIVFVITQSCIVHFSVYLHVLSCNLNFLSASVHYSNLSDLSYFPGDPIKVSTVDDDKVEASRQFEVRLRDPTENPLNILDPNHVIITITDNDGEHKQMLVQLLWESGTRLFIRN